jgi:hypothetical protein
MNTITNGLIGENDLYKLRLDVLFRFGVWLGHTQGQHEDVARLLEKARRFYEIHPALCSAAQVDEIWLVMRWLKVMRLNPELRASNAETLQKQGGQK